MKKLPYLFLLLCAVLFSCSPAKQPKYLNEDGIPIPTRSFANDFSGKMLDAQQLSNINAMLQRYQDSTTTQIVVICLPEMPSKKNGDKWDRDELANKTFRLWKPGVAGKNNGILLLIALKDREFKIETGYGAEGPLTDFICSQIKTEDLQPNFRKEKYYEGIVATIVDMKKAMGHEYNAKHASSKDTGISAGMAIFILFVILVIAIIIISAMSGSGSGGGSYSGSDSSDSFSSGGGGSDGGFSGGGGDSGGGGGGGSW